MVRAEQPGNKKIPLRRDISGHVDDWEDLAVDYLDGTLDDTAKAAVEAHLESCSSCASRLGVQQTVSTALKHTALEEAPPELEDRVLGEIMFPSKPAATVRAAAAERSRRQDMWRKKFRPWIPATVAVVALFALAIGIAVLRGGTATDLAATTTSAAAVAMNGRATEETAAAAIATTAAPATTITVAAAGAGEGDPSATDGGTTAGAQPPSVGSAGPTTTVATFGTQEMPTTSASPAIQDKKQMIAELKAASAPVYFVFEQPVAKTSEGATSAEFASALTNQITMLTGLQPVGGDLALGATTFAAYLPREDATALVELLESIGASLQLTVGLASEPVGARAGVSDHDYASALRAHAAQFPELDAQKKPPSVSVYTFTTSTLVEYRDSQPVAPDWVPPDQAGTHVLVVIYLGD